MDPGAAWYSPEFDDSAWQTGPAQLGYGDGDESTVLSFGPSANSKFRASYFRRAFWIEDSGLVRELILDLLRDDGAIVYLNGREAHRVNMPPGPVSFRTFASTASEYNWQRVELASTLLTSGTNTVAVEVHQGNASSSDLSFDLGLTAVLAAPENAKPVITLNSPADESIYAAPANIIISANALDVDGSVTNVAFFANDIKLGDASFPPYVFSWMEIPTGQYALTAVATDELGVSGLSIAARVTVSPQSGPPVVMIQQPLPGNVTNLTEITVTFSKDVFGVDPSDLLIDGVPGISVSGAGQQYTFQFSSFPAGTRTVTWSASHGITDRFSPPNLFDHHSDTAIWDYHFIDTLVPRLSSVTPSQQSTVAALTSIDIHFTEDVQNVNAADLLISSRPAAAVIGTGSGPYTFSFPQPDEGTVRVVWSPSQSIQDSAGNHFGGGSWSYRLDTNSVGVVINEIMYHSVSENPLEEFIELYNRGAAPVNLKGWKLRKAVEWEFPDVMISAGGFLTVAADVRVFQQKHPGIENVIGGWIGVLSNSRERIELYDSEVREIDSVHYADEGNWAVRRRGNLDLGHRGWLWHAEHDGLGKSLELINPNLSNDNGQNWASSKIAEGTPGRANSTLSSQTPPLISKVRHSPPVPKSSDTVQVTVELGAESDPGTRGPRRPISANTIGQTSSACCACLG